MLFYHASGNENVPRPSLLSLQAGFWCVLVVSVWTWVSVCLAALDSGWGLCQASSLKQQGYSLCGEPKLAPGPGVKQHGSSCLKSRPVCPFRRTQTQLYIALLLLDGRAVGENHKLRYETSLLFLTAWHHVWYQKHCWYENLPVKESRNLPVSKLKIKTISN